MEKITAYTRKAAATLLLAAACVTAYAGSPHRIFHKVKTNKPVLTERVKSAVTPTPLKASPNRVTTYNADVLVDEDFSGFTAGTMDQPDTTKYLASSYFEPGIYIDPSMTKDGTWAGDFVYSAGGAALLKAPYINYQAVLLTPLGDYSGEITVTCRVKAVPNWTAVGSDPDTGEDIYGFLSGSTINIMPCVGGYSSIGASDNDLGYYSLRLYETGDWTEIKVTFNNYSADNDGYMAFYTSGAILIDDIKITTAPTFIASPKVIGVTDFQAKQITVEWQPVRKAYDYYVDFYKKVYTSDTDGAFTADFEDGIPEEDWDITATELSPDGGADGSRGLIMQDGDTLVTPQNGATYKTLTFFLKQVVPNEDEMMSLSQLNVDVLTDENVWENLGYIYLYGLTDGYSVDMEYELGDFANNFKAIRLYPSRLNEGEYIIIDNFDITTNRPSTMERVIGENSFADVEGSPYTFYDIADNTTYTFTGLDPYAEYYYGIRSHYKFTFSGSPVYHAFGVCSPEAMPATDIDSRGSFTANWNLVPKATSYDVNLVGVYEAEEDIEDYVLLEDNFDKIDASVTSATDPLVPEGLYNYSDTPLDEYTMTPGWVGYGNTIVQGMLGCDYSYDGICDITTPEMYVANDDEVRIRIKAFGSAGDQLMLRINGVDYSIDFESQPDGTGVINDTYSLPVSSETIQSRFYSANYLPFMLDEISFMQNLKKGDIVRTPLRTVTTGEEDMTYVFDNLSDYDYTKFGYYIVANFEIEGKSTTSVPSELAVVDLETGDSNVTTGITDAERTEEVKVVARYSLDGRLLTAPQKGVNILKMSDGTTRKVVVK